MKIGVTGCTGRVGSLIVQELLSGKWDGAELAGGTARNVSSINADYFITDNPEELFERADAVIDFTLPETIPLHTELAAKHNTILVIGTSGLTEEHEDMVAATAKEVPVVYAANMSVGVNLMIALVEQAAARLEGKNWDAEILDIHHRYKVDAPSGTSYALAKAIKSGREEPNAELIHAREGHTGPRKEGSIGFSVQRGGDTTIENTAIFFGNGERLEITHRALDRGIFARGGIKAALWAKDKQPGQYSMMDVLEI